MADETDETPTSASETPTSGDARRSRRPRGSGKQEPTTTKQRFFTLIPAGTNLPFVKTQKTGLLISFIAILLTFAAMGYNRVTTGSALNYGIDFEGGSSVRLGLTQDIDIEDLRGVLEEEGYPGSSVVSVPDAENEVMIRVKQVQSIAEADLATCEAALAELPDGITLLDHGFVHPAESSKIFIKFSAQPSYGDVERLLGAAGCEGTASAGTGNPDEFPVEFALVGVANDIVLVIDERFGDGTVGEIVASETVGAKVGNQLKLDGVKATLVAIGCIFLYVLIRFDLRYAPGGIVALAHDATIMIGAYAITGREFNLQAIAAILTIVGYSINDTIVVFDRIRERVALFRDDPIEKTVNLSLNETLSRTILTSGTTLLVVVCTLVIGSGPIKDFAFALTVGLVAGTYSSIYMATPVFLWLNDKIYKGKGHLIGAEAAEREGTGELLADPAEGEGQADGELAADAEPLDIDAMSAGSAEPEADDEPETSDDAGPSDERKSRRRRRPKS